MDSKRKNIIILISLIFFFLILNYNFFDSSLESFFLGSQQEKVFVERVIDGDTIVTEIGHVRLLGINTPERGEKGFLEAKEFLEDLVFNESVILQYVGEREDKYRRILAYIFYKNENINVKMVEEGFGNYYFYDGKDIYSDDLEEAWDSCLEKEKGMCRPSENICSTCISINREDFSIINNCDFSCEINGWEMKEEGRDKFVFEGFLNSGEEIEFELSLDDSGGSLFLRDGVGGLVFWRESY
jgi:endonuclease YncB( thermonuclease family)